MLYPVGIQSFAEVRKGGYVYVDKTIHLWNLYHTGKYYFLSRPRRFGKSLFLSMTEAYFKGKKDLFEGLAVASLEKEWIEHPVFHFDLNSEAYTSLDDLKSLLNDYLSVYENKYGVTPAQGSTNPTRFRQLIRAAQEAANTNVVILVDEYDKPLLNTVHDKQLREEIEAELKSFYGVIKSMDSKIKFGMFTGVARFSKVSIFSDLNNLNDISLDEEFNAICGISESELDRYFKESIELLAAKRHMPYEKMREVLKNKYDGYNFSDPQFTECLYNPFSLLNCFYRKRIDDFWFDSGTPSYIIKTLTKDGLDLPSLYDDVVVDAKVMKGVNTPTKSPLTTLYQSGYLTVKAYDADKNRYTLGFPNEEVISGFNSLAFQLYGAREEGRFDISRFLQDVNEGNPDGFMHRLHALLASVPHEQAFYAEATYHNIIFLLFTLLKRDVHTELHNNLGDTDLVVRANRFVYVFEFKFNKSVAKAMQQINDKKYAEPWQTENCDVFKIAVNYSVEERNITWLVEKFIG